MNALLQKSSPEQDTVDVISAIVPFDDLESQHIQETLAWIQSGDQIFRLQKPATPLKHLVCYFIVLDEKAQKILLVDHKKAGLWLPAGGHVELNENPQDAARRECFEELAIAAEFLHETPLFLSSVTDVDHIPGHTDVSLWYVLKGEAGASYEFDQREFNSIQWFDFDEIPLQISDPHMGRFIQKLKEML